MTGIAYAACKRLIGVVNGWWPTTVNTPARRPEMVMYQCIRRYGNAIGPPSPRCATYLVVEPAWSVGRLFITISGSRPRATVPASGPPN